MYPIIITSDLTFHHVLKLLQCEDSHYMITPEDLNIHPPCCENVKS